MLCADEAGVIPKSAESHAKMMTVMVTVIEAAGFTVSENRDNACAKSGPGHPRPTGRRRSSRPEVNKDGPVLRRRRKSPRKH